MMAGRESGSKKVFEMGEKEVCVPADANDSAKRAKIHDVGERQENHWRDALNR